MVHVYKVSIALCTNFTETMSRQLRVVVPILQIVK